LTDAAQIWVIAGDINIANVTLDTLRFIDPNRVTILAKQWKAYDHYDPNSKLHDIALIQLRIGFPKNVNIAKAPLNFQPNPSTSSKYVL
jgi:hypothetical protein